MGQIDPYGRLVKLVQGFETQREAAEHLGITGPYLSDLLKQNRRITPRILEKLGLEQVVEIRESR